MFFSHAVIIACEATLAASTKIAKTYDRRYAVKKDKRAASREVNALEFRLRSQLLTEATRRRLIYSQAPASSPPRARCSVPRAYSSYQGEF